MANNGKFVNTTHNDNINVMVDNVKKLINNPYYMWSNKTGTITEYYNINKEMSTLDEGFKNIVSETGKDSPIWYNVISNLYIYGLEQVQIQMEHGEFGAESGDIGGEGIILPNTIIPYVGDMFRIGYISEKFIFRITGTTHDTLENGSNIYKITYKLDSPKDHTKDIKIKNRYEMVINNVGTEFSPIIRDCKINLIRKFESVLHHLKIYYKNIFYSERVQSFIFKVGEKRFYDPYITQFLISNSLLTGGDDYIYISQQLPLNGYFPIMYDRMMLHCIELEDFEKIRKYSYKGIGRYIDSNVTIFSTRPEDYFQVDLDHNLEEQQLYGRIQCFKEELIEGIESGQLYEGENAIYNIIIKYANNLDIESEDLELLDIEFQNNVTLFYAIPCIIFCLEKYIKHMMIRDPY